MLLAAFGVIGMTELHRMNGLKNLTSVVLSVVSVTTYAIAGLIDCGNLMIVGLSCAMVGYIGAVLARRVRNTAVLRLFIIAIGLIMAVAFFMRPAG